MYDAKTTKERIKNLCKYKRINMEDMLTACSLGVNAIRQINDAKGMSSFSLAKIADYLDCSLDYLVGRSDDDTPMSFHSEWEDTFRERFAEEYANCDSADLEAAYIDRSFCEQIIDGTAPLRFHTACDLADELGVSIDYLIGRTDNPKVNR